MSNYKKIQLIAYGCVTSAPTQVLPDGSPPNQYQADADFRAQRLCDVADFAATAYAPSIGDPSVLKLFVVPEFYFRFGGPSDPPDRLEDSYPNGEITLPNITEKILKPHFAKPTFDDWLIVAGTMFWHKSAKDSGTDHPSYFNTVLTLRGGTDTKLTAQESNANDDPMTVPTMGAASTNQKRLMSNLDYALDIDRSHWDAAINPMFRLVFGDWNSWRWHMFRVHGVNNPQGQPLVFGLEVCLEHTWAYAGQNQEAGVLRTFRTRYPAFPEIDVHILTACGMPLNPATGVEAGVNGYAVRCDGMEPADPANALWPNAEHQVVTGINRNNGIHSTSPAATMLARQNLPTELQLGTGARHNPPDAISLWSPTPLAF